VGVGGGGVTVVGGTVVTGTVVGGTVLDGAVVGGAVVGGAVVGGTVVGGAVVGTGQAAQEPANVKTVPEHLYSVPPTAQYKSPSARGMAVPKQLTGDPQPDGGAVPQAPQSTGQLVQSSPASQVPLPQDGGDVGPGPEHAISGTQLVGSSQALEQSQPSL